MNICNPIPCDCKDGESGMQGLKGPAGNQGATGSAGLMGAVGLQGGQGEQGVNGEIGIQGITGNDGTSTIVGPQGPQGPDGYDGNQGIQGLNGLDGIDGAVGADACAIIYNDTSIYGIQTDCPPNDTPICNIAPCIVPGINVDSCGYYWFNRMIGDGFLLFLMPNITPAFGYGTSIMGVRVDCCAWKVGVQFGRIELTAYNSLTDNITTSNSLGSPCYGDGAGVVAFDAANGSDYMEMIHIGNNHYVIVEANFANEQFPTFT